MRVELKERGIDDALRLLQSLPAELVSKRGGPVKLSLKKGANVLRVQAAANLQRATSNATDSSERESTGLLLKNLIVSRGKPPTSGKGERYLVRVKRVSYPDRTGRGKTTTNENAARLEYGNEKQPAEPWLRPAFLAKAETAIRVIQIYLVARIDRIVKKYLKAGAR